MSNGTTHFVGITLCNSTLLPIRRFAPNTPALLGSLVVAGLETWDTRNFRDTCCMFCHCLKLKCDLSGWRTPKAKDMKLMFYDCPVFESDLSTFDISKVKSTELMFADCPRFVSDLSSWDTRKCMHMGRMFENAGKFDLSCTDGWKPESCGGWGG